MANWVSDYLIPNHKKARVKKFLEHCEGANRTEGTTRMPQGPPAGQTDGWDESKQSFKWRGGRREENKVLTHFALLLYFRIFSVSLRLGGGGVHSCFLILLDSVLISSYCRKQPPLPNLREWPHVGDEPYCPAPALALGCLSNFCDCPSSLFHLLGAPSSECAQRPVRV